jgi:catechol 2,3-dioxygenase-like lactoylglutathione lyase family enzyme
MTTTDSMRALRITLCVRDLDRTLRFYRELGLPIRRRDDRSAELKLGDQATLDIRQSDAALDEPKLELSIQIADPAVLLPRAQRLGPTREVHGDGFTVVDPDAITVRVRRSAAARAVDEASDESFPASDPPSFTAG